MSLVRLSPMHKLGKLQVLAESRKLNSLYALENVEIRRKLSFLFPPKI